MPPALLPAKRIRGRGPRPSSQTRPLITITVHVNPCHAHYILKSAWGAFNVQVEGTPINGDGKLQAQDGENMAVLQVGEKAIKIKKVLTSREDIEKGLNKSDSMEPRGVISGLKGKPLKIRDLANNRTEIWI